VPNYEVKKGMTTMAVQGIEALDMLQTRLSKMLEVMADLRERSRTLQDYVEELEKEMAAKTEELTRLHEDNARLQRIEEEHRQLVAEREIVRNKVEGMLNHLEKFELA
jgi:predicted nuclease with TOPRIM domain